VSSRPPNHQLPIRHGVCRPPTTGVSKPVDHGLSVAVCPRHLSRYGRLISGSGGRVWPVLTSADTPAAIGIDQDRDGGRGVRLTPDPRRPESAPRSMCFHGADRGTMRFWAPRTRSLPRGRPNSRPARPTQNRPPESEALSIGGLRLGNAIGVSPIHAVALFRPSSLTNVKLDKLHRVCQPVEGV
jgi:hypothetical protein